PHRGAPGAGGRRAGPRDRGQRGHGAGPRRRAAAPCGAVASLRRGGAPGGREAALKAGRSALRVKEPT
ncbi:MAG: hypothetical protein E6J77_25765, partial [Deltaproteobacteria bacterium]